MGRKTHFVVCPFWLLCLTLCQSFDGLPIPEQRLRRVISSKQVSATPAAERAPAAEAFRLLLPKLKQETKVPLLLPSRLPYTVAKQRIFASGIGDASGYEITLASRPQCGANSCFIGFFKAKKGEQPVYEKKVNLANGITGFYKPLTCGGSCSPPEIEWVQDGVLYSVQFEVQWRTDLTPSKEESLMIDLANSAIEAGAR